MTDPRNPTADPVLALKLAIADCVAERRELAPDLWSLSPGKRAEAKRRQALLTKQIEVLRQQLRETLKEMEPKGETK